MSFNLEMLQVAGLAPRILGDASENIVHFIESCFDPESGGYRGRSGPDTYYCVFALSCLRALKADIPQDDVARWLNQEYDSRFDKLDFIALGSWIRAYALLPDKQIPQTYLPKIRERLNAYRSKDGGFHNFEQDAEKGTAYGCFIGLGALLDLEENLSNPDALFESLMQLQTNDGAFVFDHSVKEGTTPVTAGAVSVLHYLQKDFDKDKIINWLCARQYEDGGFFASPQTPLPDLLSTATALHALTTLEHQLPENVREKHLDFIDSLWTAKGGFHGSWADDYLDCEYTFYGLLALGHLSL